MGSLEASVVVGFRDWGADRVRRSVTSIMESFDGIAGECIISDYGSADPGPAEQVAKDLGAGYIYTPGDPVWSRARALNAGFAIAKGKLFISTDADMLFSPRSMRKIIETAHEAEDCALFLQCRDLPANMGDEYFSETATVDWEVLERAGRLRPRWGMGGMMAISALGFSAIRGFDERLHTYGGEDLDFARRAQRAGYRTVWVDEPEVRMFHMWHPPTIRNVEKTEAGRVAVAYNRDVVYNDKTYVRNSLNWQFRPFKSEPLVSVGIATRNRSHLLKETLLSILAQTIQDFEIVVVDDGSDDELTRESIQEIADPRIRYFWQPQGGISKARNRALDESRGQFTAVMDDDDLMPPQRFEWQLNAITDTYAGSVGSFVNFDDESGEMHLIISRVPSLAQALEKGGAPGHGTWLIRTDVMRNIRYDEGVLSGVDNNFFLRLLRTGYKISHCGKPVLLRRRHSRQVTMVDSHGQSDAAKQALQFIRFRFSESRVKSITSATAEKQYPNSGERADMIRSVQPYLPDNLVTRNARASLRKEMVPFAKFDGEARTTILKRNDVELASEVVVRDASYADLATLSTIGTELASEAIGSNAQKPSHEGAWVVTAIADYLHQSKLDATIAITGPFDSQQIEEGEDVVYSMNDGQNLTSISISQADEPGRQPANQKIWMIVGQTVAEVWT